MLETGPLIDGIVNGIAAVAFLGVAVALSRRSYAWDSRPAVWGFAAFWGLYGLNLGFASWRLLRVAFGNFEVFPFAVIFIVETGLAVLALHGLGLHLLYVLRGHYKGHFLLLVAVWIVAIAMGAIVVSHGPQEVIVEDWRTDLVFAIPLAAAIRWGMVLTYYGAILSGAGILARMGLRASGDSRVRALGLSTALVLLAAMDMIILGPEEPLPGGVWATSGKVVAVGLVAWLYFWQPMYRSAHQQEET